MSDPDNHANVLDTAYRLFVKQGQYFDALCAALRTGDDAAVPELFSQCKDKLMKK